MIHYFMKTGSWGNKGRGSGLPSMIWMALMSVGEADILETHTGEEQAFITNGVIELTRGMHMTSVSN